MLTPEEEKFVTDLRLIYQKKAQIESFAQTRRTDEAALAVQYKVDEMNVARAALVTQYNNDTAQLNADIKILLENIGK